MNGQKADNSTGSNHLHLANNTEPDMARLSPRFDTGGSRSRSHSRGSRSPSSNTLENSEKNGQKNSSQANAQTDAKEAASLQTSSNQPQATSEAKVKKSKKQEQQSAKKQQQQQKLEQQQQQKLELQQQKLEQQQQKLEQQQQANQAQTLQSQISRHGSRCDNDTVIREEEEDGELEAERTSKEGGSGPWKRGQSADRKSRASTSTSTSSTTTAKSRKFFDQWKQAATMSKLGNRTKNLLGKWKSHSQSVDIVLGTNGGSGPATPGANAGINASGVRITHDGLGGHHGVMGSDPGSTDGHAFAIDKQEAPPQKGKAQWSEHVWTAWVHRGFSDDVTEMSTVQPAGDLITDFQKDKFRHFFFHVLDLNSDCVISSEDFEKLNERIRHYMDWSVNSIQYLALKEVHGTFLECFLNTAANFAKKNDEFDYWDPFKRLDALYDKMLQDRGVKDVEVPGKTCVSIDEWVDVWGILVGKAKKMDDFPMWLQYYPKVLFDVINRSGSGIISKSELKYFYTAFMDVGKLGEQRLDEITTNAYRAMTSDGDVRLTYHIYKLSFLNFLLGKQPNGPGQYIFGTVLPAQPYCMFPIDYSAMNASEEDIEPFRHEKLEEKGSRRSVIV